MPTYGSGLSVITSPPSAPPIQTLADRLLWRWVLTDLNGETLSIMDHLARERQVVRKLVGPSTMTGTVPSDSFEINLHHTDGDPFLSEGNRLLYGFRRENATSPYWVIRASGIVLQVEDAVDTDIASTRFTAYDPWQYLYALPVLRSQFAKTYALDAIPASEQGWLLPANGIKYPPTMRVDQIITDILGTTFAAMLPPGGNLNVAPMPDGPQNGFFEYGTIEQVPSFGDYYPIEQGATIGQVLEDIVGTGYCDVVFKPLYDPVGSPGFISSFNVYKGPKGACSSEADDFGFNYGSIFAWDRPSRDLVGLTRNQDGTQRANEVQYFNGQGGTPIYSSGRLPFYDAASVSKYGPYFTQQFFPQALPGRQGVIAIKAIAQAQLALRSTHKTTVTVNPAPEFSPEPFIDYDLGDRVPVYAGLDFNPDGPDVPVAFPRPKNLLPNQFREEIGHEFAGEIAFQRIVEIPIDIDDNSNEMVRELVVGPAGEPPPPTFGPNTTIDTNLTQNRRQSQNRTGSVGRFG